MPKLLSIRYYISALVAYQRNLLHIICKYIYLSAATILATNKILHNQKKPFLGATTYVYMYRYLGILCAYCLLPALTKKVFK